MKRDRVQGNAASRAASSRRAVTPPRPPALSFAAVLLVLFGLALWPLAAAGRTPAASAPTEGGWGAPSPPVLHAGGPLLPTAAGTTLHPAPPSAEAFATRHAPGAEGASDGPVRGVRTQAQAIFGRRNLDGG